MADKINGKEAKEAFVALIDFYGPLNLVNPATKWAWETVEQYVIQQSKMGRPKKKLKGTPRLAR